MDSVTKRLTEAGCRVSENEPMTRHTSFRIGGAAQWFVVASLEEQVAAVLHLCRESALPLTVVGNGSNLLVRDGGIDGIVLRPELKTLNRHENTVTAGGGLPLSQLCRFSCEQGLRGMEFAYGIPGTVGGGIYMNAGAYGGELSDVVTEVRLMAYDGTVFTKTADEMAFGYRHSVLADQPAIVLSATVALSPDDPAAIRTRMEEILARRSEKQPLEYPSAGSFFKRPEGNYAAALIDRCGLKGCAVNEAQISEKHAGFLINRGNATCADVLALGDHVSRQVYEQTGVTLEREVRLIGKE